MANEPNKPNGPMAAALLAGGIGATLFGLIVFVADLSKPFSEKLNW